MDKLNKTKAYISELFSSYNNPKLTPEQWYAIEEIIKQE